MLPIQFTLIAAVGPNGELGKGDELAYRNPDDLQHFVRTTTEIGHVVVGRKTWNAIPDKYRPLAGRTAYVLSRDPGAVKNGANHRVVVCRSIEELISVLNNRGVEHAAVIGGAEVYAQFAPLANKLILTHFKEPRPDADVIFPGWPISDAWTRRGGALNLSEPFWIADYTPNKPLKVEKIDVAPFPLEYAQLQAAKPRPAVATAVATGPKDTRVLTVTRADVDALARGWGDEPALTQGFWQYPVGDLAWDAASFRARASVETDPTYLQPIPYVVVQRESDGAVLSYRRPSKIAENRLAGMRSIGFGGHIEPGDHRIMRSRERTVDDLARAAARRELSEELGIGIYDLDLETVGTVFEGETQVGTVHVGIVMVARLRYQFVHPDEDEIVEPLWYAPDHLLREINADETSFERWSRIVGRALLVP